MSLSGKTLFITGASRGIGKAIALRAARDGAHIVVAAKTIEPHPKLPGTIYSTAEEITAAGGQALPVAVDIRDDGQVEAAVQAAVTRFGGIDILVNNASAISLTGTLDTPMKRYDLMHQVNVRGTFLCSQKALPHLRRAKNPHILNLAPPLQSTLQPKWFSRHLAYTMAKYGMSLCVLGMAEEFKSDGIAVNALWPRTTIDTEAIRLIAGDEARKRTRSPEIMADAAHIILTRPSRELTGRFLVDDEVLREAGVTDFSRYRRPGVNEEDLTPDVFV
ncbi:MAG TPA: NAD(P)-dependent oxidoreductase [Vicinamibacterales bacterium]|nr:NAD(P)-dependent oxidoreductase [Vicinamibacterales bacterium]